jgi:hypothetical protein
MNLSPQQAQALYLHLQNFLSSTPDLPAPTLEACNAVVVALGGQPVAPVATRPSELFVVLGPLAPAFAIPATQHLVQAAGSVGLSMLDTPQCLVVMRLEAGVPVQRRWVYDLSHQLGVLGIPYRLPDETPHLWPTITTCFYDALVTT